MATTTFFRRGGEGEPIEARTEPPYSAKAIANYFLDLAKSKRQTLTPMKLQKLIYFAHGWHLAMYGEPLIDEQVQAWDYGPVIHSIYTEFREFGAGPIEDRATDLDVALMALVTPAVHPNDKRTIQFLNRIWEVYGKYSAIQLSNLTHTPGAPWQEARKQAQSLRSVAISNDLIGKYFRAKVKAKPKQA